MTAFYDLAVPAQNFTAFWALLLCLYCIAETIMLFRQKRYHLMPAVGLCFFVAYFIMHICRDGTMQRLYGIGNDFAMQVLHLPYIIILAACLVLTILCALLYWNITSWRKTHISAASIKESMDGLPAGICFYLEDGRCILSNHRMNDICFSLLGSALQNGAQFYDSISTKPIHQLSDGTAFSFHHRELTYRGAPLHELIANDITDLYKKSEELKANNERLRKMAENMKAYSETITDTVRQKEILQAKINIHDEMNRMILTTRKSLIETPTSERQEILRIWQQVLLLCKQSDTRKTNSAVADLNTLAAAIGIRLVWSGLPTVLPHAVQPLFLAAAREAMTNAIKHAQATILDISIQDNCDSFQARFTNDGKTPDQPVTASGGLLNLCQRLESAGGQMKIETKPVFCLDVIIPKEPKPKMFCLSDRRGKCPPR
ncbi:MAG: hypothetical protein IJM59_13875 [Proteobacteria bacterium]|nr:hypothetical protein [Pseudomonadota bacterium]